MKRYLIFALLGPLIGGFLLLLANTYAAGYWNETSPGEVAKLFVEAGLVVLCSFISPFRAERRMVRELLGEGEFIEVFCDTPLEECARRDPKGLYAKAMKGEIAHFTGVTSPYEAPEAAEIVLCPQDGDAARLAGRVMAELKARGLI